MRLFGLIPGCLPLCTFLRNTMSWSVQVLYKSIIAWVVYKHRNSFHTVLTSRAAKIKMPTDWGLTTVHLLLHRQL